MIRAGGRAAALSLALFLPASGPAWGDQACLAEVKAFRAEVAADSRLLAIARGGLDTAVALCQAGRVEEARELLQDLRSQAGIAMGQGK